MVSFGVLASLAKLISSWPTEPSSCAVFIPFLSLGYHTPTAGFYIDDKLFKKKTIILSKQFLHEYNLNWKSTFQSNLLKYNTIKQSLHLNEYFRLTSRVKIFIISIVFHYKLLHFENNIQGIRGDEIHTTNSYSVFNTH